MSFLKKEKEIVQWLETVGITNYTLVRDHNNDYMVDVEGNVFFMPPLSLKSFPVKFNHIKNGGFCARFIDLESLEGAPNIVDHEFAVSSNLLRSLKGGPHTVGRDYFCTSNRLEDLDGIPRSAGYFHYGNNPALGVSEYLTLEELHIITEKAQLSQSIAQTFNKPTLQKL